MLRVCVLFGALTAAGGAAYIASTVVGAPEPQQFAAPVAPKLETEQVLVLASDVEVGGKLEQATLKWQEWPSASVHANFITRTAVPDAVVKFSGRVVTASLNAGQPLNAKNLHDGRNDFLAGNLPSGMRAYSVKISPETGAGGFILPEDRVDVVLTREQRSSDENEQPTYVSETVLTNIEIMAIDQITDRESGKKRVAIGKTATLQVDPRQAESLAVSDKLGTLSLMLRSVADAGDVRREYDENATVPMRVHAPQDGTIKVANYTVRIDNSVYDAQRLALNSNSYLSPN